LSDKINNAVLTQLNGSSCSQVARTEYFDSLSSTWKEFDPNDVESRTTSLSTKNDRYQVTSFLPPAKKMTLVLNNFDQQYNTGIAGPKSNIVKKNLLIRASSGYDLTFIATTGEVNDDFTARTKFVHTQLDSGCIKSDVSQFFGTYDTAAFTNHYDSTTYDSETYTGLGYYKKTFQLPSLASLQQPTQIDLYSATNRHRFKYKVSQYSDFFGSEWSTFSSIATGVNSKYLTADYNDNYIQYMMTYDANTYRDNDMLCTATLFYNDKTSISKKGVYIIDDPVFSEKVNITGRDYLRKGLETEINIPPFTTATNISTLISRVLDRCSIPYDISEWDSTGTTALVSADNHNTFNNITGYKALDYFMDYLNAGDDDWQFQFGQDGNAILKNVVSKEELDHVVLANINVLGNATKSTDSDKQIQRVTALNKNITVNAEATLAIYTGTTDTSTSFHATYSSAALYVRYEDDNGVILSEDARGNTGITFSTRVSKPYTIRIFGCTPKNAITDEVWSERGNSDNILNNDGNTYKKTNILFTQTACDDYTDYVIAKFGQPASKVSYTQWANPFMNINDNCFFYDTDTSTNNILNVVSIKESWNPPALNEMVELIDTGDVLTGVSWDRNGVLVGINDLKYDSGVIWDMDVPFSQTGTTYTSVKDKQFS
jgi:hypothetical protein